MLKVDKLILLPKEDSGVRNLIVRVHGTLIKSSFQRRQPVVICNPENGAKIIRYVMGSGSLSGVTKSAIAIDYDGLDTLGYKMKKDQPCELLVRKAKPFETYQFFIRHPDLAVQLSIKLGLTGVALGMVGLVLGAVSLA